MTIAYKEDQNRIWAETTFYVSRFLHSWRMTRFGPQEIDEIVSETVCRLWTRQLEKPLPEKDLPRMGIAIAKNVVIDRFRKYQRNIPVPLEEANEPFVAPQMEEHLIREEMRSRVRKVLAELSTRDQDILRRVIIEGQSKETVAQEFGVARGYLRVLLHRAKESFQRHFREDALKTNAVSPCWTLTERAAEDIEMEDGHEHND
jgi:RNA polymerase sigma-70 factor (ECF subfamily)